MGFWSTSICFSVTYPYLQIFRNFFICCCRLLAFAVAGLYVTLKRESNHGCPLYKFSFASFSNIMSSWFQYEALKFVTFPTQVTLGLVLSVASFAVLALANSNLLIVKHTSRRVLKLYILHYAQNEVNDLSLFANSKIRIRVERVSVMK